MKVENRRISESKHNEIVRLLKKGDGILKVAALTCVGVRTVQRRRDMLDVQAASKAAGVQFVPKAKKCPIHGKVRIWPCVACEAEKARVSRHR